VTWLEAIVPHLKALHLSFVAIWVAGLFGLPHMLARHDRNIIQAEFDQIRKATHFGYIWVITPFAVLAIISGTWLILVLSIYTVWIFAKLVLVTGLVAIHAWVGHNIIAVGETEGHHEPIGPIIPTILTFALTLSILCLVLAKPALRPPMPSWLMQPLGHQLPFDTPNR
jgi:putative membrane protein